MEHRNEGTIIGRWLQRIWRRGRSGEPTEKPDPASPSDSEMEGWVREHGFGSSRGEDMITSDARRTMVRDAMRNEQERRRPAE